VWWGQKGDIALSCGLESLGSAHVVSPYQGSPENAGLENGGPKKSRGWKMQDWKMSDEIARLEFDGLAMRVRVRQSQMNESICHKH